MLDFSDPYLFLFIYTKTTDINPTNQNCIKKEARNILDSITRKCYHTNNSYWKTMKKKNYMRGCVTK